MKSRRYRASGPLLELLESRRLLSINMAPIHPTLYPDDHPAVASITGVRSANSAMSDLHAYIRYDTGRAVAATLAPQLDGSIDVMTTNPPGPGAHSLFVAFWQSVPNSRAVKNVLTTRTTIVVRNYTSGGVDGSGFAGQAFTGVVATFTDADLPSSISGETTPLNFSGSANHNTEIIALIHWGDGQDGSYGKLVQNQDSTWSIIGSHVYAAPGNYSVHVTMTTFTSAGDSLGVAVPGGQEGSSLDGPITASGEVVISGIDLAPVTILDTASRVSVASRTGATPQPVAILGVSTAFALGHIGLGFLPAEADASSRPSLGIIRSSTPDASGVSEYVVGIQWGDGTSSMAQLVANANGGWDVIGQHTYLKLGVHTVEVDVVGVTGNGTVHPYDLVTRFKTTVDVGVNVAPAARV